MNLGIDSIFGNFLQPYKTGPMSGDKRVSDQALLNKLQQFNINVDKASLLKLGKDAIAIEEVCDALTGHLPLHMKNSPEFDWAFASLIELWKRWYPDRIMFETLLLRASNVLDLLEHDNLTAAARVWYKTWPLCLRFFDMCKIDSAPEFRSRFPKYSDLLDYILYVAEGLADDGERRHFLDARISFCEQLLERLSPSFEQDELTDGIRAILADSYMVTDRTEKVDSLYRSFLEKNPTWSFAYSDWFYCYWRENTLETDAKAESILRQGLKALDARDEIFDPELYEHKKHLLAMLAQFLEKQERVMELQEIQERLEEFQEPEGKDEINGVVTERDALAERLCRLCCQRPFKAPKIGRNDRCPCLGGVKFRRCCGR